MVVPMTSHSAVVSTPRTLPALFSFHSRPLRSLNVSFPLTSRMSESNTEDEPSVPDTSQNDNPDPVPVEAPRMLLAQHNGDAATSTDSVSEERNDTQLNEDGATSTDSVSEERNDTQLNEDVATSTDSVSEGRNETFDNPAVDSTSESRPTVDGSALDDAQISSSDMPSSDTVPMNADAISIYDNPVPSCSSSDDVTTSSPGPSRIRQSCRFGITCYRQSEQHRTEFSHPGDEDYGSEETHCSSSTDVNSNKPACWYGPRCYRKNTAHLEAYSHNFTRSGRPKRTTRVRVEINSTSDESEELDDFSDSDEYDVSFIDDDDESSDDIDSEDDIVSEISDSSNASETEEKKDSKKRRKTSSKRKKKKKESHPS